MTKIQNHELVVFVGYAGDAADLAGRLEQLKPKLQEQLEAALRHRRDDCPLKTVRVWSWEDDLGGERRGQNGIDPVIHRAHVALFVFRGRVGEVTRREVELARGRGDDDLPVYALFPKRAPESADEEEGAAAWTALLRFRRSLSKDWPADDSKALRPTHRFGSGEELETIVLERFAADLAGILDRAEQPTPDAAVESPRALVLRSGYLDVIERATHHIRLVGIGAGSRAKEARALQPIETLYTRLFARSAHVTVDLAELLPATARLLIEGHPGAGKTTFLRLVACMLARDAMGVPCPTGQPWRTSLLGLAADRPARIPVLLSAASLALSMQQPSEREDNRHWLLDLLVKYCSDNRIAVDGSTFEALFSAGDAFVLIDGLDEVADEELRRRVFTVFDDVCTHWISCPFVVTSRPIQTSELRTTHGFTHTAIEPFRRAQMDAFLQRFAAALHGNERERPDADGDAYLAELRSAILQRRDMRLLAENPVMITSLCVVHWNDGQLPRGRARVYRAVIDWLIRSKREAREEFGYSDTFAQSAFSRLALAMTAHEHGKQKSIELESAAAAIDGVVERHFPDLDRLERRARARHWLRYECLGSGIVQELPDGRLEFWHLTFQEYLAACELALGLDDPEDEHAWWPTVRDHLEDPQWRETLELLPASLFGDRDQGRVDRLLGFVQGLARREHESDLAFDARSAGLVGRFLPAVEALGYVANPAIRESHLRSQERAMAIFTVAGAAQVPLRERLRAAEALGRAGDPRLADDGFERNLRPVRTGEGWRLGIYPVTVQEYLAFVDDEGYSRPEFWTTDWPERERRDWIEPADLEWQLRHPNRPITGVSWHEARAYCAWMTQRYGLAVSLPTVAQRQAAAVAADGEYPWGGDYPGREHANFDRDVGHPTPVGLYPLGLGPQGHADLAGNVWEWSADVQRIDSDGDRWIHVQGGSWSTNADYLRTVQPRHLRSAFEVTYLAWNRGGTVGFRVAVAPVGVVTPA
ncbi:MAG: SUMF1/EgtB/PvdO family nonheme iron enzyme [Planctomycetes bacterium]|nr:SUMF1/EgtB/PvdO family nonheme iron enzyme [Planctomycetota bacterium]